MRIVHLDASSGITGTGLLGALLDVGASLEAVQGAVASLGVGHVRITLGRVRRGAVTATSIRVRAPEQTPSLDTWVRIRAVLAFAAVPDGVRAQAASCFARIAQAESACRGVPVDAVTFPQVVALDSLAEIVGSCAALASLAPERVTCGPVTIGEVGAGATAAATTAPDPVVRALVQGLTVRHAPSSAVATDAAGVALVAGAAQPVTEPPPMQIERNGCGAGGPDRASEAVVRVYLGTARGHPAA